MILFDLDNTLANCEHRKHFIDPSKNPDYEYSNYWIDPCGNVIHEMDKEGFPRWHHKKTCHPWEPDWDAFFEACSDDEPIIQSFQILHALKKNEWPIQIWSGRPESVREKTEKWLFDQAMFLGIIPPYFSRLPLKMRPIGDYTPDDVLKERWLDEALAEGKTIDYVFDDRKKVIDMWRRRGIFVFDVSQGKGEF